MDLQCSIRFFDHFRLDRGEFGLDCHRRGSGIRRHFHGPEVRRPGSSHHCYCRQTYRHLVAKDLLLEDLGVEEDLADWAGLAWLEDPAGWAVGRVEADLALRAGLVVEGDPVERGDLGVSADLGE